MISQPWGTAVLNGSIPVGSAGKDMDLQVQANRLDLALLAKEFFFALPPMRGLVDLDIRLTQKAGAPFIFDPQLAGDFTFTDLYLQQMQLGTVKGKLNSGKEMILFSLQIPQLNSEISGQTDLHDPFQTEIGFSTRAGPLPEFVKLLPVPFQDRIAGTISAQAQATFLPLKFAASLQISLLASDLLLKTGEQTIWNKKPLRLAYRSGGLIVESASLLMGQMEIDASGELPCKPQAGKEINFSAKGGEIF